MKSIYFIIVIGLFCIGVVMAASWTIQRFPDHVEILVRGAKAQQLEMEIRQAVPGSNPSSYLVNTTHSMVYIPRNLTNKELLIIIQQLVRHVPDYTNEIEDARLKYMESNLTYWMGNYETLPPGQQRQAIRTLINYTVRKFKR